MRHLGNPLVVIRQRIKGVQDMYEQKTPSHARCRGNLDDRRKHGGDVDLSLTVRMMQTLGAREHSNLGECAR